jgi:hypothetical protein
MRARLRVAGVLFAVLALLAACGGGGDDDATPSTPPPDDVEDYEEEPSAEPSTQELGETVTYAGFALTLEEAEFTPPGDGLFEPGTVEITGTAENQGEATSSAPNDVFIEREGSAIEETNSDIPEVPGGSTAEVTYSFLIDDAEFDLDGAELVFGSAEVAQARVPLDGQGEAVTNEPVDIAVSGTITAGSSVFNVKGATVRFDRPDQHTQAEAGKAFLTVTYDVTNNGTGGGGYPFVQEDVKLTTPGGLSERAVETPIELIANGTTMPGLISIWAIPSDEPGTYVFTGLRNPGTADEASGTVDIEVPALG